MFHCCTRCIAEVANVLSSAPSLFLLLLASVRVALQRWPVCWSLCPQLFLLLLAGVHVALQRWSVLGAAVMWAPCRLGTLCTLPWSFWWRCCRYAMIYTFTWYIYTLYNYLDWIMDLYHGTMIYVFIDMCALPYSCWWLCHRYEIIYLYTCICDDLFIHLYMWWFMLIDLLIRTLPWSCWHCYRYVHYSDWLWCRKTFRQSIWPTNYVCFWPVKS